MERGGSSLEGSVCEGRKRRGVFRPFLALLLFVFPDGGFLCDDFQSQRGGQGHAPRHRGLVLGTATEGTRSMLALPQGSDGNCNISTELRR